MECKHEFVYDEQIGEVVCRNCGHILTKEDKQKALEKSMNLLRADEHKQQNNCKNCRKRMGE